MPVALGITNKNNKGTIFHHVNKTATKKEIITLIKRMKWNISFVSTNSHSSDYQVSHSSLWTAWAFCFHCSSATVYVSLFFSILSTVPRVFFFYQLCRRVRREIKKLKNQNALRLSRQTSAPPTRQQREITWVRQSAEEQGPEASGGLENRELKLEAKKQAFVEWQKTSTSTCLYKWQARLPLTSTKTRTLEVWSFGEATFYMHQRFGTSDASDQTSYFGL